jgi:hypothetical protein
MLVEFISPNQDQQVTLLLPHPASEDPVGVSLLTSNGIKYERDLSCIYIEIAEFAQEVSNLPEGWEGKVSFSSLEDDFVILCRARVGDFVVIDFTLESGPDEEEWLVRASIEVPISVMKLMAIDVSKHVKQC